MKFLLLFPGYFALCCLFSPAMAQPQPVSSIIAAQPGDLQKTLFETDEILHIKIAGNTREVMNDRGENPKYHPLTLSYFTKDSIEIAIPVKIKTRGHFRKEYTNCTWPPLLINFPKKDMPAASLFKGQDKLKLVMPCRHDEYITREWLLYELYNLVTPNSFRARLVRVVMEDIKKKSTSFYGILLEDEEQMADRNKVMLVEKKKLDPKFTDTGAFLNMAVFQYMIGNTDWSVQYQQNIRLVATDSLALPLTVPYDFDHAGLVNAPYARPADELGMISVMERRYRGYCISDMKVFDPVIALFNRLKKDIYSVYTSCSLLEAKYVKSATKYLDEFYITINNPKALQSAFSYPCDINGTGNVIIKGMKKD